MFSFGISSQIGIAAAIFTWLHRSKLLPSGLQEKNNKWATSELWKNAWDH